MAGDLMIHFINGRSGSGKSMRLLDIVCEKAKSVDSSDNNNIILIVPEQCSFQNEREILRRLGPNKAQNIEVLSLRRLCDYAEREYGKNPRKELTDGARLILMNLAIESVKESLKLYGERAGKSDLTSLMMTVISEYKICSILPEDIMNFSRKMPDGRLKKKLYDSALIFEAYEALMSDTYRDPLDKLSIVYDVLYEHKFFAGKTVAIDSFHSFTADEMRLISLCAVSSKDLYITLCRDVYINDKDSIFYFVNRTYRKLKKIANENSIECREINLPDGNETRFKAESLKNVEELIFRREELECDNDGAVTLYRADDIYDEAEQAARYISKLIRDGYKYSEIAIICRDSEMYRGIINSAFSKYDIPLFVSYPERLEAKPLMRFVLSALEAAVGAFSTDSVLTMLKTGMTSISDNDVFELENYTFLWDIKGKDWQKPFTRSVDGFNDRKSEKSAETLQRLEAHRRLVSDSLLSLRNKMKTGDGAAMARAVYELLEDFDAFECVKKLSSYLENNGETILADEEIRLWDMMIDILDTLHETLEGKYISPQTFFDLMKLIISQSSISTIPRTMDEVTLGNADTVRPQAPRAVLVLGAIEGIFPKTPTESGIFTSLERDELIGMSLPLTDSIGTLYYQEEFFAYKACSAASEKLFISYYTEEESGEKTVESRILTEIKAIIRDIKVQTRVDIPLEDIVCTKASALEQYALLKRRDLTASRTIGQCIAEYPDLSGRVLSVDRAFDRKPFQFSDTQNSKKLFGNDMNVSATQIEEYHRCAFRYFCRYGINAQPNERAKFDPRQYGTVVHFIFERLLSPEYGIEKLSRQSREERIKAVEAVLQEYLLMIGGEEEKPASFSRLFNGITLTVMMILDRLIAELTMSEFKPVCVELPIGGENGIPPYEVILPDGGRVYIRGKIDRVDEMKRVDGSGRSTEYVRIIDYKTGRKEFNLDDILCGINIQMLLYLSAISKNGAKQLGDNIVPCGVLYMPSSISYIDGDGKTPDDISEERNKMLSMNGIMINDKEILEAMNGGETAFVKYEKTNTSDRSTPPVKVCSQDDLNMIFRKIDEIIINMAESLQGGKIAASPLMIRKKTTSKAALNGCDYCPYDSICAYEDGMDSSIHIRLDKTEDVLECIRNDTTEKPQGRE